MKKSFKAKILGDYGLKIKGRTEVTIFPPDRKIEGLGYDSSVTYIKVGRKPFKKGKFKIMSKYSSDRLYSRYAYGNVSVTICDEKLSKFLGVIPSKLYIKPLKNKK